jgi:hypothetical protein
MWQALIVAFVLAAASPAAAQTCAPPSAEHAFEELLVALVDDSPQEHEAWRIAGEQEAKGAFESEETIRRLDEFAAGEALAYDCASRTYRPLAGGPTPAEVVEAREEEEEEAAELAQGRGDQPAQPDHRPAPSRAIGPGAPAAPGAPVPDGQGPATGGGATLAGGDSGAPPSAAPGGGRAGDPATSRGGGSPGSPDPVAVVPEPGEAPTGRAVAALAGDDTSGRDRTGVTRWLAGVVLAAGLAGVGGAAARSRRRSRLLGP